MTEAVGAGDELELYGAECTVPEIRQFLRSTFERNTMAIERGYPRETACIWGLHGIGKTDVGKQFAEEGYEVRDVPIAQFEEMGDFHGMPEIVIEEGTGRHITRQALPDWVPAEEKKGILLFDDWNRADSRIVKGIMQLIQDYRMITWSIPHGWTIVLTANPDGGDYLVTTLDDAVLTRIRHITMVADVEAWAQWATDNNVDSRGISFVLRHKEVITNSNSRTNPRTLTEFFRTLQDMPDLKSEARAVEINAMASLDPETATTFLTFVNSDMSLLVEAMDIFDRFEEIRPKLEMAINGTDGTMNLDILGVICGRVMFEAAKKGFEPNQTQIANFQKFLCDDLVPADKVHQILRYINQIQSDQRDSKAYTLAMSNQQLLEKIKDVLTN